MDDAFIYIFVRQDLPLALQLVHVAHAALHAAAKWQISGTPTIVVIGAPHPTALDRIRKKLESESIASYEWSDPDDLSLSVTAIATAPLMPDKKQALSNYRLWSYKP